MRLCSRVLALLLTTWRLAGPAAGAEPGVPPLEELLSPDLDVRSLPSLVVRWTCHCNPIGAAVGPAPGGGAVYVQSYRRFFALDAETHDVLWDHKLEEAHPQVAPPLLLDDRVVFAYRDRLYLVDPASGVIVAEVEPEGSVERLVGPPLAVDVALPSKEDGTYRRVRLRIDETSGHVVARRPVPVSEPDPDVEAPIQAEWDEPATLRRVDPETGEVLWTIPLAHRASAWIRDGEELLVHTRPQDGGRGLLLTLDAATGEVLRVAYGFAGVASLARWDDLLIAVAADEVVAFEADALGPPEAQVRPVADEVDRLLGRLEGRRQPHADDTVAAELESLGPEALPLLLARLPALAPQAALTVVQVLSAARYEPAAPRVAELLATFPELPEHAPEEWSNVGPETSILRGLARLGGPEEVPVIGEVLLDGDRDPRVHEQALESLAAIGGPAAAEWAERFYAARAPDGPVWQPPDPAPWLALHRDELDRRDEAWVGEHEHLRRTAGWTAAVGEGDDRLLVFYASQVAVTDLWAVPFPATGEEAEAAREPLFLGVLLQDLAGEELPGVEERLQGERRGSRLTLWIDGKKTLARTVDLEAVARDRDGDALPDPAEARLGTDPARADTDGDGRPDAHDPAPRGGAEPRSEEDRIRWAIVRHFTAFRQHHVEGPFCVATDRSLEWSDGGAGRIVLPAPRAEEAEVPPWCYALRVEPADEGEAAEYRKHNPALGPDEQLWVLNANSTHFAQGHWLVLRPVAGRWLVRHMTMWWIT